MVSRIPLPYFKRFRSIHRQNLVQSNISSATFGAANCLLLPIGIPVLMGMPNLLVPVLIGASMGMLIDLFMLYWLFDSRVFAARNAWPPGLGAAEAIIAGDQGGQRGLLLLGGTVVGVAGNFLGVSMSAFGVAFIGNIFALAMFGVGLLIRGYSIPLLNIDINKILCPARHDDRRRPGRTHPDHHHAHQARREGGCGKDSRLGRADPFGGRHSVWPRQGPWSVCSGRDHSRRHQWPNGRCPFPSMLWIVYAAVSCIIAEFIVGLSAMHAGWFPAFATALIFLVLGMLMGFPPVACAVLVGFVASGGPAFADAGYDLKADTTCGRWTHLAFEMDWAVAADHRRPVRAGRRVDHGHAVQGRLLHPEPVPARRQGVS